MYFLSKSYQRFLDWAIDTLGRKKYVVDGFNAVQKRYLAIFLRMCSTPQVEKIDIKCMRVDAMTEKVEVRFAEVCKSLLELSD